jgi:hypothetical protein
VYLTYAVLGEHFFVAIIDQGMTVHGIARYLKRATIILEINDRTVSSINFRITFDYMRYAFNYHHAGKLISQVFHSQSRE